MRSGHLARVATVAAGLLVLAACGSGGGASESDGSAADRNPGDGPASHASGSISALYEAAKEEGSLTWYTSKPPYASVEKFNEKYPGIHVEVLRLAASALATRFAQERSAGASAAGLISIADEGFIDEAKAKGWLKASPNLPSLKDWPKKYYSDGVAITGFSPVGIAYNSDLVDQEDVPSKWSDLLNPSFKGKAIMPDPRVAPVYMHVAALWKKAFGADYLRKLGQQEPTLADSVVPTLQQVAAGANSIAFMASHTTTQELKQKGAPIEWVQPSPSTGSVYYTGVVKGTDQTAAASLFMNFLLTKQGQAASNPWIVSPLGKVGNHTGALPPGFEILPYQKVTKQRTELIRLLGLPPGGH